MWNHRKEYFYKWSQKAKAAASLDLQECSFSKEKFDFLSAFIEGIDFGNEDSFLCYLLKIAKTMNDYQQLSEKHLRDKAVRYLTQEEFDSMNDFKKKDVFVFSNKDMAVIKWERD